MTSPTDKTLWGNVLRLGDPPTELTEEQLIALLELTTSSGRILHINEFIPGVITEAYAAGRQYAIVLPTSPTGYWKLDHLQASGYSTLSDDDTTLVLRNTLPAVTPDVWAEVVIEEGEDNSTTYSEVSGGFIVAHETTVYAYPTGAGKHDNVTMFISLVPVEV